MTQPPPASPHQWKTEHLLRAASLRRSAWNRYGCLSVSFFNVHSSASAHAVTAMAARPHGHGLTAIRQQLSFFLSFSSLFWSSPFLSSFFFFFLLQLTDWLRFCPSFSLLFAVLYNYLFNWQFVFFLVFIYFTVSVVSTLYTAHCTYQSQIGNLSFSYSLFILLFQYTTHINHLFTWFI